MTVKQFSLLVRKACFLNLVSITNRWRMRQKNVIICLQLKAN